MKYKLILFLILSISVPMQKLEAQEMMLTIKEDIKKEDNKESIIHIIVPKKLFLKLKKEIKTTNGTIIWSKDKDHENYNSIKHPTFKFILPNSSTEQLDYAYCNPQECRKLSVNYAVSSKNEITEILISNPKNFEKIKNIINSILENYNLIPKQSIKSSNTILIDFTTTVISEFNGKLNINFKAGDQVRKNQEIGTIKKEKEIIPLLAPTTGIILKKTKKHKIKKGEDIYKIGIIPL